MFSLSLPTPFPLSLSHFFSLSLSLSYPLCSSHILPLSLCFTLSVSLPLFSLFPLSLFFLSFISGALETLVILHECLISSPDSLLGSGRKP